MNPLLVISLVFAVIGAEKHTCRWDLCPYKGVTKSQASKVVATYAGEMCTDAYYIDMLHISYPTLDADQLDSLLSIQHP
jgi:hypothetical protein